MKQRTPPIEPDDGGMASPVFAQEEKKRRTGGTGERGAFVSEGEDM